MAIRSAAIVYCVRSLVPIERKSTTSSIRCASSAALGTSTITPALRPRSRTLSANSAPRRRSPPSAPSPRSRCRSRAAACATPSSWRSSRPGLPKESRSPRTPSAGFSSPSMGRERDRLVRAGVEGADDDVLAASGRTAARAPRRRCSACSSTDGSSLRLRKHSSVRNSPTPSTGAVAAARADSPSATLARILTGLPSAVSPGPVHAASAARASRPPPPGARPPRRRGRARPCRRCRRRAARVPAASVITPATPTTQGMPSWRAMIAVWLVGPPRSVTSATTTAGSRPAVSAGARSSATSTDGHVRAPGRPARARRPGGRRPAARCRAGR